MDDLQGDGEGARWVSYAQLAQARGISKDSVIRLARRERWRKMPGNDADKTVRILVPSAYLQPAARPDALPATREDVPQGELSRLISMFETGLVTLREQLAVANGRAEAAEQGRDGERQRADAANERAADALGLADRTLAQLADAQTRADRAEDQADELRARIEALQAQLAAAQAALQGADTLKAAVDAARQARGLLARLRAAWRGR